MVYSGRGIAEFISTFSAMRRNDRAGSYQFIAKRRNDQVRASPDDNTTTTPVLNPLKLKAPIDEAGLSTTGLPASRRNGSNS
jgi:hypothetical protein